MKYLTLTEDEASLIRSMSNRLGTVQQQNIDMGVNEPVAKVLSKDVALCNSIIEKIDNTKDYSGMSPEVSLWLVGQLKQLHTLYGEDFDRWYKSLDAELQCHGLKLEPTVAHKYGVTYSVDPEPTENIVYGYIERQSKDGRWVSLFEVCNHYKIEPREALQMIKALLNEKRIQRISTRKISDGKINTVIKFGLPGLNPPADYVIG